MCRYQQALIVKKRFKSSDRSEAFLQELRREAEISQYVGSISDQSNRSSHPNIVPFVGACLDPDHPSLMYTYLPGGSLETVLLKDKRYNSDTLPSAMKLLKMACEAAEGILFLHSKRVVHRDIGCRNLLLDRNDVVW